MNISAYGNKIYAQLLALYQWYLLTPERSLEEAYKAAYAIKAIEDEHFNGGKIEADSSSYSNSAIAYFESDLKKQLKNARMRLTEFRASRYFLTEASRKNARELGLEYSSPAEILEKLKFIDGVIAKYTDYDDEINSQALTTTTPPPVVNGKPLESALVPVASPQKPPTVYPGQNLNGNSRSKTNSTGVLPRSILSTITRLQVELDPNAEQEVVRKFRKAQRRTIIAIRFLLLLVIVPILTHQLSKTVLVGPLVDRFRNPETAQIFINTEMEEEAFAELQRFEEGIKFKNLLIGEAPPVEEIEKEVKEKAHEIAEEFRAESSNAIKNVFSDIVSVFAFIWLLLVSKQEIAIVKEFFDNVVYGLSDSAKAFIIILFTDVFVGFHSPHGWEVILEGVARHWGVAANHSFIFLFIATFPVILDTIFKYWIFRYLNRISPSAVATYRNMNE